MDRSVSARLHHCPAFGVPEIRPARHIAPPARKRGVGRAPTLSVAVAAAAMLILPANPAPAAADGGAYSTFHPVVSVRDTGPPANRYDYMLATDGYTEAEDDRAQELAAEIANYLVTRADEKPVHDSCRDGPAGCRIDTEPYVRYRNFLNFHRIRAYSRAYFDTDDLNLHGALMGDRGRDLAHDSIFGLSVGGPQPVEATAQDSADGAGIDMDARGWLADAGIRWTVYPWPQATAAHHLPGELFAHEGGHGNHGLLDEYFYDPDAVHAGGEPDAWNVTSDSDCGKWKGWLGFHDPRISPSTGEPLGEIGCYSGAMNSASGMYRPVKGKAASRMWRDNPFHRVSMEKVIHDIYGAVRPLDSYRDNSQLLTDPQLLWVDEVDPAVIKVNWSVLSAQGTPTWLFEKGGALDVHSLGLAEGRYSITAHAYDEAIRFAGTADAPGGADLGDLDSLDIVRKPEVIERMQQKVTWQLEITRDGSSDPLAGIHVPAGQQFTVDRRFPSGAVLGWVVARAPHGHTFGLVDPPAWLGIHAATGRLEVIDAGALAGQDPGEIAVTVVAKLDSPRVEVQAEISIDVNDVRLGMLDDFDDGDAASNVRNIGRGFTVVRAVNGSAVEGSGDATADGVLSLNIADSNGPGEVIVLSKDSFDISGDGNLRVTWTLSRASSRGGRCHVFLAPARAPLDEELAGYRHSPAFGFHISACDPDTGPVMVSTPLRSGRPYLALPGEQSGSGGTAEKSYPLTIELIGNRDEYSVYENGALLSTGPWPPELGDPPGLFQFSEPWARRTVRVGAMLQGRSRDVLELDIVEVSAAAPARDPRLAVRLERAIQDRQVTEGEAISLDLAQHFSSTDPLRFRFTGLPPGVTPDDDGSVTGVVTHAGSYEVNVLASSGPATASGTFTIAVKPRTVTPTKPIPGLYVARGQDISLSLAKHFEGSAAIRFSAVGLPPGVTLDAGGSLAGAATRSGEYDVTVIAASGTVAASGTFTIKVVPQLPQIGFRVGEPLSLPVRVLFDDFAREADTLDMTGLPGGLHFDAETGYIRGVATAPGVADVTVWMHRGAAVRRYSMRLLVRAG